jgi:hypothetical protein
VSPDDILLAAFFCIGIPFLLFFHSLVAVIGIWRGVKKVWGSLLSLVFGLPFIFGTLGVAVPADHEGLFHILSYNVNGFNDLSGKVGSDRQLGFKIVLNCINGTYTDHFSLEVIIVPQASRGPALPVG